jgi:hypothetical protein
MLRRLDFAEDTRRDFRFFSSSRFELQTSASRSRGTQPDNKPEWAAVQPPAPFLQSTTSLSTRT